MAVIWITLRVILFDKVLKPIVIRGIEYAAQKVGESIAKRQKKDQPEKDQKG
jgi:hypothetical protein